MNENKEITTAVTETVSEAVAAEHSEPAAAPVMDISPKPAKKGSFGKKLITVILACGVVAGGIYAARTFLKPDPEVTVKKAVVNTASII